MIVVTGSIATGKSSVCAILKEYGIEIVDADKISHAILDFNAEYIGKVFGKKYIKNEKVDRKELGKLIFNNIDKKRELEDFLHPKIKDEIYKQVEYLKKYKRRFVVDIPLYYETKRYKADIVALVYAPKDLQIKRLMRRDKCSKKDALKKINIQIDIEKKRKLADIIIDNSKDINHLKKEIKKFIDTIGDINANFKI